MVKTRKEASVSLVGTTDPESLVQQVKLPTVGCVMKRFFFLLSSLNSVVFAISKTTSELLQVWQKTTIICQMHKNVARTIRNLLAELKMAQKDSYRDTERKRKWRIRMDQLLDVSLKKVIIEDPKVAEFLEDQRKERNFSLSSINEPQLYKRTKNEHKHAEEEEEQEATGTL